jgi:hypothetical protein
MREPDGERDYPAEPQADLQQFEIEWLTEKFGPHDAIPLHDDSTSRSPPLSASWRQNK